MRNMIDEADAAMQSRVRERAAALSKLNARACVARDRERERESLADSITSTCTRRRGDISYCSDV